MESTDKILFHLYGERDDAEELVELLRDEDARLEYETLGEVKDLLDSQPLARPRRAVLESIFDEAARHCPSPAEVEPTPARPGPARVDRPAKPSTRTRSIPAYAGTLVALSLLIGLGWWHFSADGPLLPTQEREQEAAQVESAAAAADGETDAPVATGEEAEVLEIPSWDESDDFVRLRRQLQLIDDRSQEEGWDESVIPLEMSREGASMPTLTSAQ